MLHSHLQLWMAIFTGKKKRELIKLTYCTYLVSLMGCTAYYLSRLTLILPNIDTSVISSADSYCNGY